MSQALSRDDGVTLIELLMAVAILGVAIVTIVGGMFTTVATSATHRDQSDAGTVLRSYADAVTGAPYADCASSYTYTPPAGFTVSMAVTYWQAGATAPAAFAASGAAGSPCPAGADSGLQRIVLTVVSPDQRATERLVMVKRRHESGELP